MVRYLIISLLLYAHFIRIDGQSRGNIRIMFYNTENLFDTEDDPATLDDDFTPTGIMHWTQAKYHTKILNVYKVIAGVGGWQPPEIIGLAEVENRLVLNDLLTKTPLSKFNYQIVHFESPDPRGIDVALLFRFDKIKLLQQEPIFINFRDNPNRKTRNILLAKFLCEGHDTLWMFVNHWPSRRGGEIESEDLRFEAANTLRQRIDLIHKSHPAAKIIAMGDFNDEPSDLSLVNHLKAHPPASPFAAKQLYNLSFNLLKTSKTGSHYFSGHWSVLDQMIVSGNLLSNKHGLFTKPDDAHIFSADFILQTDKKNLGVKPLPTYSGRKYIGGFSDHLPIYLDLYLKN